MKNKFLLDTHIWVWSLNQPERLSRAVRREIEKPRNELYLSPISIWEAGQMAQRRRIDASNFGAWVERAFAVSTCIEAPITFQVATEAAGIRLPQNDIADVIIAATASVLGLTLITADEQLLACRWLNTLANECS